jgi:hypothetical protein
MTRRTPVLSMARTVLLGFFALADFALWYVRPLCPHPVDQRGWIVRSHPLPYGSSNPHRERDETSLGRNEGTQARASTLDEFILHLNRASTSLIGLYIITRITSNVV